MQVLRCDGSTVRDGALAWVGTASRAFCLALDELQGGDHADEPGPSQGSGQ